MRCKVKLSIILGGVAPIHQYGTTGWIHVVLSRVRTLSGVFLLVKLCEDVTKYRTRLVGMKEMERLRAIGKATLHRLQHMLYAISFFVVISDILHIARLFVI